MEFNKLKVVAGLIVAATLVACSSNKEQTVTYVAGNEQALYQKATTALLNKKWTSAEQLLTQLSLQYPFGVNAREVSVLQAYVDYEKNNFDIVQAQIDKYFQTFGTQRNVPYGDYMLYLHALAGFESNRGFFQKVFGLNRADNDTSGIEAGLGDLRTLMDAYPTSLYVASAKELFNYYSDKIAEHNYSVAKYELKADDPLAAYKRANIVLINFPDSYYVQPTLKLMEQAIAKLNLDYSQEYAAIKAKFDAISPRPLVNKAPKAVDLRPAFLLNLANQPSESK